MDQLEAQATNGGHLIEQFTGTVPTFFSAQIGRDYASPLCGWTSERDQATVYASQEEAEAALGRMTHMLPFCKVVAK